MKLWVTQNEPQCFIGLGHLDGVHAPGDKLKFGDYLLAAHNGMRAHAKSVQALRAHVKDPKGTKIGYVLSAQIAQPASDKPEDVEAARAATFAVSGRHHWNNAWWTDPVVLGKYPEDGVAEYGKDMPKFKPSDLDEMKQPIDFLGLNIYKADTYKRGADGKPERVPVPAGYPRAGSDWQTITPASMYWGPRFFYDRYKLPLSITENGLAMRDQVFLDGKVHDPQRIDFMHRYLTRAGARDQGRRAGHRLLRLVAARQLRVGRRLQAALRAGLRRLPDAEARPEGFVRLVPEADRVERQDPGREDRRCRSRRSRRKS